MSKMKSQWYHDTCQLRDRCAGAQDKVIYDTLCTNFGRGYCLYFLTNSPVALSLGDLNSTEFEPKRAFVNGRQAWAFVGVGA
jgi:hypothetical protein